MVAQATDFLAQVALSSWDAKHYGQITAGPYGGWQIDRAHPEKNRILAVWYALTGMRIPDKWFVDGVQPPPPPPKPKFRQDLSSFATLPASERIDGYAAERFLAERRSADDLVLVD